MSVKCDEYNQIGVLAVDGDLSAENCALVRQGVEERMNSRQIVDFVVDAEKCGFIDSEGLETLLWIKHKCEDVFGQVKLAGLDENCRKILELTRLEHRFECQKDVASALKTMR